MGATGVALDLARDGIDAVIKKNRVACIATRSQAPRSRTPSERKAVSDSIAQHLVPQWEHLDAAFAATQARRDALKAGVVEQRVAITAQIADGLGWGK